MSKRNKRVKVTMSLIPSLTGMSFMKGTLDLLSSLSSQKTVERQFVTVGPSIHKHPLIPYNPIG